MGQKSISQEQFDFLMGKTLETQQKLIVVLLENLDKTMPESKAKEIHDLIIDSNKMINAVTKVRNIKPTNLHVITQN